MPLLPKQITCWSVDNVIAWALVTGFRVDATRLRSEHVDGAMLVELDDEQLEELGVATPKERKILLNQLLNLCGAAVLRK